MDKKEYLKNSFKRDFLRYGLLPEDSLSAKEVAESYLLQLTLTG